MKVITQHISACKIFSTKMWLFVIYIFLLSPEILFSQELNFIQVDTSTYNMYMRGDWSGVVETGKKAVNQGFDYYYLHMRIAYALFVEEKYRQAIPYYKNALKHNSKDPTAFEYLYYAYKYSGMQLDATRLIDDLTPEQKNRLKIPKHGILTVGINHTYGRSNLKNAYESIMEKAGKDPVNTAGVRKATYFLNNSSLQLKHLLFKNILFDHGISYMKKLEYSYFVDNDYPGYPYISAEQYLDQIEHWTQVKIPLGKGFYFNPGFHRIITDIPIFNYNSYGRNAGSDRTVSDEIRLKNLLPLITFEKKSTYMDAAVSYVHHNFNTINTNQFGLHLTLYPFSNLNLYASSDLYLQNKDYRGEKRNTWMFVPEIGAKVHKNLWLEFKPILMEQFGLYDVRSNIAYNNLEKVDRAYTFKVHIPFYKIPLSIHLQYSFQSVNSYFFPESNMHDPVNKYTYRSNFITGGIKWVK
ncbi:MAG TPA: tetratricopeptide repeat protein [Bacteroidales bacterium]|nr:tetratricopeptide repeat protein [Bacteroidales bacterium]